MKLQNLEVENFRCIQKATITANSLTAFVGPNNAGKSTILRAIELLLTPKQTFDSSDVCGHYKGDTIGISAIFHELDENEKEIFHDFLSSNSTIAVRKQAAILEGGKVDTASKQIAVTHHDVYWFLTREATSRLSSVTKVKSELGIYTEESLKRFLQDHVSKAPTRDELRTFQEAWWAEHPDISVDMDMVWLDIPKSVEEYLPAVEFLPAELTIDDDTTLKSGSLFSRITKHLMASLTTTIQEVQDGLDKAVAVLESEETTAIKASFETAISNELTDWSVTAQIGIKKPDASSLVEKAFVLTLMDGHTSDAISKGHGLQRATFFALTRTLAKLQTDAGDAVTQNRSLIILVEEPELYLHPHAQRQLRTSLYQLSTVRNTQVLLATHSTYFLDFAHVENIRRVSRRKTGEQPVQVHSYVPPAESSFPEKVAQNINYWLNPHRNEMFFSSLVILVEGQTESVVLPVIAEELGIDTTTISVIDANGKGSLTHYIHVLNGFHIPYVVVHDEDPLTRNEAEYTNVQHYRNDKNTYELNKKIEEHLDTSFGRQCILQPDFEGMFGVSKNSVDKFGKSLAAQKKLEEYLSQSPVAFPKQIGNLVDQIRDLISSIDRA